MKRRAERDVLGPGDGAITRCQVLDGFGDMHPTAAQHEAPLEQQPGTRQARRRHQLIVDAADLVRNDRRFSVDRDSSQEFFRRRRAERVEAQVVGP